MTRKISIILMVLSALPVVLQAQPSRLVHYSGMIESTDGSGFTGTADLTINIYRAPKATTPMWTETHNNVAITDGRYNIIMGSINPLKLSFYEYYLDVIASSGIAPSERQMIVGSGYNYRMWFLFSAYTIIWLAIFLYLVSIARRQKRIITELVNLRDDSSGE